MSPRLAPALLLTFPLLLVGCNGKAKQEAAIRKRAKEALVLIVNKDADALVEYVDPVYVRAQGQAKVKGQLGLLMLFAALAKVGEDDVRVDSVEIDGENATVMSSIRLKDEWQESKPGTWVRVDGTWYIRI